MTTLCLKAENNKDEKSIIFDISDSQVYETSYKFNLKNKLDKNIYNYFAENGLYENKAKAYNDNNSQFAIHRLVSSTYSNINNLQIHHIDKCKKNNNMYNLLPISKETHLHLDNLPLEQCIIESQKLHDNYSFKLPISKDTLSTNNELIKIILQHPELTAKKLEKLLHKKIKSSTISKYRQLYKYPDEFLQWLEINENKGYSELCRNLGKHWDNLVQFEQKVIDRNPKYKAYFEHS